MKPIQISPAAAGDLLVIAEFLGGESGDPFLGDRFFSAAASTFDLLATFPFAGRARPKRQQGLSPLHSLAIDRPFNKYLAFYQPLQTAILFIRVLHGAQDLGAHLNVDPERDA